MSECTRPRPAISRILSASRCQRDRRPILDSRLPDGSRSIAWSCAGSQGNTDQHSAFCQNRHHCEFLPGTPKPSPRAMEFLDLQRSKYPNIMVSGGGVGRANVLTCGFGEKERIIVIEDTRELPGACACGLERPPDAYGAVRCVHPIYHRLAHTPRSHCGRRSARWRAWMIQAMTSGHHGSLTAAYAAR